MTALVAPVVFTDLDDTLFQTLRKHPNQNTETLRLMSTLADGTPSGYANARQENLLGWLRAGQVIPVTARSVAVVARVAIEQAPAICSNGGCIMLEDGFDKTWHSQMQAAAAQGPNLEDVYAAIAPSLDERYRHWIVSENGLALYIVIKSNVDDGQILSDWEAAHANLIPPGWRCHKNGNNLAYLPAWLSKRHAVTYLIDKIRIQTPDAPIIGVGDSTSDAGFMDVCDFAMTPTDSQLWASVRCGNGWMR